MSTGGGKRAIIAAFFAEPRHRDRQVHRLRVHQLRVDAGREHPLLRRHRQPGSPAARRPPRPQGAGRRAPVRLRARAVLLGLRRGACCSRRPLFAIFEGIDKIRHPHELESIEWAIGILLVGHGARGVLVPHRDRSRRTTCAAASRWRYIRRAKEPELPVVLLEDSGALIGLVIALTAVDRLEGHRRRGAGRRRHAVHRHPARDHRHRPCRRDEEPPDRRGRADDLSAIEQAIVSSPDVRAADPPAHASTWPPTSSSSARRSSPLRPRHDRAREAIDDVERRCPRGRAHRSAST